MGREMETRFYNFCANHFFYQLDDAHHFSLRHTELKVNRDIVSQKMAAQYIKMGVPVVEAVEPDHQSIVMVYHFRSSMKIENLK